MDKVCGSCGFECGGKVGVLSMWVKWVSVGVWMKWEGRLCGGKVCGCC